MTIEIADRLVKLRKKYGYSQEELADKLGLSRQAVSKWERAEASPDTDNLICLAKLYGVSLDELLATDEDIDTIIEEQVKEDKKEEPKAEEKAKNERVVINDDGIRVNKKDGGTVVINDDGVTCIDKDGNITKRRGKEDHDKGMAIIGGIEGILTLLCVVGYILLGFLFNLWLSAWILIFIPEIVCSIARAIRKGNAHQFNMPFLATFAYFFFCLFMPEIQPGFPALWHPLWVVFFAIPIYYTTVSLINKALGKEEHHRKDKDDDDEDDEDEDD